MSEFPVVIPPKQNPEAQIIHIKDDGRTTTECFRRSYVVRTLAKFNETLQNAAIKINEGPKLYQAYARYGMFTYGNVYGRGPDDIPEFLIEKWAREKQVYEAWHKRMLRYPLAYSLALRFCQDETTIKALRRAENLTDTTVFALIQFALNQYAVIAGWGDQIEPRK